MSNPHYTFGPTICPHCLNIGRIRTDPPTRAGPLISYCDCINGQAVLEQDLRDSTLTVELTEEQRNAAAQHWKDDTGP